MSPTNKICRNWQYLAIGEGVKRQFILWNFLKKYLSQNNVYHKNIRYSIVFSKSTTILVGQKLVMQKVILRADVKTYFIENRVCITHSNIWGNS
jgi:hypothetical protein